MIKRYITSGLIAAALAFSMAVVSAQEQKKKADPDAERTIKGKITCAKCDLSQTDACQNAIQTTRKDKEGKEQKVTFYLEQNDVSKAFHKNVCKGAKDGSVTGKVKREGDKMILTASKIELAQ